MTEICKNTVFYKEKSNSEKSAGNKVHFVYVLLKIRNKALLFLLTLLPLFVADDLSSGQLLAAVLVQLLTVSAVLVPALMSRHYLRWSFDGKYIYHVSGILTQKQFSISSANIRSVSIVRTPFLSLFRAVRLDMRCSDGASAPEVTLFLSPDQAEYLSSKIMRPSRINHTMIPRTAPFLLMSASRANFAAGLSIVAVFIFSLTGGSNNQIPENAYSKLSDTARLILPYLPPVISVSAACFLLGWFVHFLKLCLSDAKQITRVTKDSLITVRGLISSRLTCIKRDSVSSCFMKQTIFSSLFKQSSIGLSFYGQQRKNELLILNAWHTDDCENSCLDLIGTEKTSDITVKTAPDAHLILWLPYASAAAFIAALWFRLFVVSPVWFEAFSFIAAVIFIILLWKCAVGIKAAEKIKLTFSGQHISVTAVRLFSVYSQKIFHGKTARFEIRRTILQKPRNLCTVYVKAAGASKGLKCINLPYDIVCSLSERIK